MRIRGLRFGYAVMGVFLIQSLLSVGTAHAQPACSQWTRAEFLDFKTQQVQAQGWSQIRSVSETCATEIQSLGLAACYENVAKYSVTKSLTSGHRLQFFTPDTQYYFDKASRIQLPPELVDGLPFSSIPENFDDLIAADRIEEIQPASLRPLARRLRSGEWMYILYTSQSFGNPTQGAGGRSFRRFLVYAPGETRGTLDLFIQITYPRADERQYLIDAIGMQKIEDAIAERGPDALPEMVFTQFWRIYGSQGNTVVRAAPRMWFDNTTLSEVLPGNVGHNYSMDTCQTCHSSGLRRLNPAELNPTSTVADRFILTGPRLTSFKSKVQQFNSKMLDYGRVDFVASRISDPTAYGTMMGESTQLARDYFNQCFQQAGYTDPRKIQQLVRSANCTACHDTHPAAQMAGLSANYNQGTGGGIQLKMLVEKSMPPGPLDPETLRFEPRTDLTDADRTALFNCLVGQQRESTARWIASESECAP
jgi:hypothetical protein